MRSRTSRYRIARAMILAPAVLVFSAACGGHNHLSEYNFTSRSLALVYIAPPRPELVTGWYNVPDVNDPVATVVAAGSGVAKEVEGRRARTRLDSAVALVDLTAIMSQRTLERTSRYLGATPAKDRERGFPSRSEHAQFRDRSPPAEHCVSVHERDRGTAGCAHWARDMELRCGRPEPADAVSVWWKSRRHWRDHGGCAEHGFRGGFPACARGSGRLLIQRDKRRITSGAARSSAIKSSGSSTEPELCCAEHFRRPAPEGDATFCVSALLERGRRGRFPGGPSSLAQERSTMAVRCRYSRWLVTRFRRVGFRCC